MSLTPMILWAARGALLLAAALVTTSLLRRASAARAARDRIGAADVRVSAAIDVPSVTGIFAPVVLLPLAALDWDAERCRVVLLHELAHVARRDCLAQLVASIGCAVAWFDPFAWIVASRMRAERELAADEDVVAAGARASTYAGHLVAIAALAKRPAP